MRLYVLGIEPFKVAEVYGIHVNKKVAQQQAESIKRKQTKMCCQRYEVLTETEIEKRGYELYI